MDNQYWEQSEDSVLGTWQKKITQISGSPTFCVLPWIHLATRPNGDSRLCCVANASGVESGDYSIGLIKFENKSVANFAKDLPSTVHDSDYLRNVRLDMLNGKVPASCSKCFKEEAQGISSKRIWETGSWYKNNLDIKELITSTDKNGSVPFKLKYLDLRLGNTCNLKCVMCSPHDSSMWEPEHKKIFPLFSSPVIKKQLELDTSRANYIWHENQKFWDEIYQQIPNLEELYFAGGEPLIIKQHKIFLKEIIRLGYAKNISIRYNTNGILLDDELIGIWEQFKKVRVGISLDALGERLYYIRYPSDWAKLENNLIKLDQTSEVIQCDITLAAQLLNIKHIPELIKWKVKQNFKKINLSTNVLGQIYGGGLIGVHLVWIPVWLSLKVLPKEDKKQVRESFNELKDWLLENYTTSDDFWKNNPYGWSRWQGILDWMDSEDHSHLLPDFVEYIRVLDNQRQTNFVNTFPELSHLYSYDKENKVSN